MTLWVSTPSPRGDFGCAGFVLGSDDAWHDIKQAFSSLSEGGFLTEGETDVSTLDAVLVIAVVDGDTIDVQFSDGSEERVRLVGIDTPECNGENDPEKWPGIDDPIILDDGARRQGGGDLELLAAHVYLDYDAIAGMREKYGRLLAYVILPDGRNYNVSLVQDGLARVYTAASCELYESLLAYEDAAKSAGKGVWSQASFTVRSGVCIDTINPFAEYVVITNHADETANPGRWQLHYEAGKTFVFLHSFSLAPGRASGSTPELVSTRSRHSTGHLTPTCGTQ
jgi:micrococcal nuclease